MDVDPLCPVCFDAAPEIVLPCGHKFCRSCISNQSIRKCPICRQDKKYDWLFGDWGRYAAEGTNIPNPQAHCKETIQAQVDNNGSLATNNIACVSIDGGTKWVPVSDRVDWSKVNKIKVESWN